MRFLNVTWIYSRRARTASRPARKHAGRSCVVLTRLAARANAVGGVNTSDRPIGFEAAASRGRLAVRWRRQGAPIGCLFGIWILGFGASLTASAQTTPFARLPLYFEASRSQADGAGQFLARGCNYQFLLSPAHAQVILSKPASPGLAPDRGREIGPRPTIARTVQIDFVGANPCALIRGAGELPGKINYFVGNDRAQWRSGVATYDKVEVESLYEGINLVYYGNQQQLEYDFTVAPGASVSAIEIHFEGADKTTIDSRGELVLTLGDAEVRHPRPAIYQVIAGKRKPVSGGYRLKDAQTVGFEVGDYDPRIPLVIDPVLTYSTYFGGRTADTAVAVKVDAAGAVYVAGITQGNLSNAPAGFNGGKIDGDAFVAKFDSTLTNLVFLTYWGGSGEDGAYDMALDPANNIYLTGFTDSTDFPTNIPPGGVIGLPNATHLSGTENRTLHAFPVDAFVTEIDASGSNLVYSIYLGGTDADVGEGIAVDNAGNAYVAGHTFSTNFPTQNAFQDQNNGTNGTADGFIVRIAAGGASLDYATYFGGTNLDYAEAIAVNTSASDGVAYVTGFTASTNFPTTPDALQTQTNLNHSTNAIGQFDKTAPPFDAFLAKFDTTQAGSNSLLYCTLLGGTNNDVGYRLTVDSSTANVFVTGYTESADFPNLRTNVPGLYSSVSTNSKAIGLNADVFLAKFAPDNTLSYSVLFGGDRNDVGWDVAVDPTGNTLGVVGFSASTNFPTALTAGLLSATNHGNNDAFVTLFTGINSDPPALLYSTYLGGWNNDSAYGIALDSATNAYVVGRTLSTNFPTLAPSGMVPFQPFFSRSNSAFLAKIELTGVQVAVTIQTLPTNLIVILDGSDSPAPVSYMDFPGYPHTISTLLVQTNGGQRYVWTSWSDHGPLTHQIAPTSDATITATFETPPPNAVAVVTNGNGTVSPNFNQHILKTGQRYSMTARPRPGYLFAGWTGSIETNSPTLTFVMEDGLVFEANFIHSPFIPLAGSYAGLFTNAVGVAFDSSGFFSATLNTLGGFSAKIQLAGKAYSISSRFSNDGSYSNSIPRRGLSPLSVSLQLDLSGSGILTGQISDGIWTADLLANRAIFSIVAPTSYTLVIPGAADSTAQPGGDGFGSAFVGVFGNIQFNGTLADGTKIAQKSFLSVNNTWPFFASLYSGKGSILGWLTFTNDLTLNDDLGGQLSWFKLPQPRAKIYPAGFTLQTNAVGSIYSPAYFSATNGSTLLNFTNGLVVLENANLTQPITNRISISPKNKVTNLDSNKLSLTFATSSGLFHGNVVDPATLKNIAFSGALLQKQTNGFGFFLDNNQSGHMLLTPAP